MGKQALSQDGQSDHVVTSSSRDELESLRVAKRQAEIKLQLLKKRYEEEIASFNETRVEHIFKNSGAREYLERLKDRAKIKDEIIKNLKEDLEFKTKELSELQDRCRDAEKQSEEYLKAWKDATLAREMEKKSNAPRERPLVPNQRSFNMSSASSLIEHNTVPPPPPIEAPTMEEIFRTPAPTRGPNPFTGLNSSIPPPPDIEVPLDEILSETGEGDRRAFEREKGQFMCSVYLSIDLDSSQDTLGDIVELIESEQSRSASRAFKGWISLNHQSDALEKSDFHVTLIRGHRAIHYHQIKPLVAAVEELCKNFEPSVVCLDKLRLFRNNEQTKQFLAITTRNDQSSAELADFIKLKRMLRDIVDQFADRVTQEDETDDTIPHCSVMFREVQQVQSDDEIKADLQEIEQLCNENLDEYVCLVNVDTINLKIGKEVYKFKF